MFGLFGKEMQLINHMVLLGKQAIFQCRHLNLHLSLSLLKAKLKNLYRLECVIADQNNVIENHIEKWKAILHHIKKLPGVSCVYGGISMTKFNTGIELSKS